LDALPDATLIVGQRGQLFEANVQAEKLFGYPRDELQGRLVEQLLPERFRSLHVEHRRRYLEHPHARWMCTGRDLCARHRDGHDFPVDVSLNPVKTEQGLLVVCAIRDVSQRRELEEQLRDVSGRLIHAQEEERSRVARELHDDVNQRLALLSVELDLLGPSDSAMVQETRQRIAELGTQVKQVASELHHLSHELHPSNLEQLGLVSAVRSFCTERAERCGVRIDFSHRRIPKSIGKDVALCLYRIVQEALRNVVKHSGAEDARVELVGISDAIRLRVSDTGVGFRPETASAARGLGLVSMQERLRLIGGEMSIEPRPSRGTRIDVRVPLVPPTDELRPRPLRDHDAMVAVHDGRERCE
jgi:PAS domain S-box-containing protein